MTTDNTEVMGSHLPLQVPVKGESAMWDEHHKELKLSEERRRNRV